MLTFAEFEWKGNEEEGNTTQNTQNTTQDL